MACIWNIITATKSELSEYFLLWLWCMPLGPATLCWWIRMRKCLLSMPKQSYSTKLWDHGCDWKCPNHVAKYVKKKKYQGHTSRNPPWEISDTRCMGLRGDRDNPSRTILHLWEHLMSSSEPTMNKKREIWRKEKFRELVHSPTETPQNSGEK